MLLQQIAEGVFIIDNFLSSQECGQLIEYSKSLGYKPADVDVHGQRQMLSMIRTNERVDLQSAKLATQLWNKLPHKNLLIDGQSPVGPTPFLHFYRYEGAEVQYA